MYRQRVLLIIFNVITIVSGLNVLFIIPFFGKSHYLVFETLINQMSKKGHNVSVIVNTETSNFEDYRIIDIVERSYNKSGMLSLNSFTGTRMDIYNRIASQGQYSKMCCERLKSERLQAFLNENLTFDIIVAEVFNTNCFYGLQSKYNAPIVGLSSTDFLPWMYQWFGCPENPSYIPVLFMDYADKLTFLQRVENTLMLIYSKLYHYYYIVPSGNEYSKKYLGVDIYEGGDIFYNISLLLINRHYSFHTPKPLTPNVIEVGGIHIQPPKTLPQELKKIVESSKHGVIFMSMGSTLKGSTFPEVQRKLFLKVFSQLNQTIIWKWENETMEDVPANVKIMKWLPQLDLLCHPNVKLFITHGGLLGTQEGVYCAIPMLILPQFADQHYNAAILKRSGASLNLKLRSATEKDFFQAIYELLTPEFNEGFPSIGYSPDPYPFCWMTGSSKIRKSLTSQQLKWFSKNLKALSERFKDRPMSPMDTAIYWIEYVARHKGAPFMKSAVTDMPFYQSLLLDVIASLILIVTMLISCLYFTIIFIVKLCKFNSKLKVKTD